MKTILKHLGKLEKIQNILFQAIHGTGLEYVWKEVNKISQISSEDTIEKEEDISNSNREIIKRKFNWSQLYGTLEVRKISIYFIK